MTELDWALETAIVGATGAALVIFLVGTATRRQPAPESETDFGVVFGAFLAAWLAMEIFEVVAPPWLDDPGAFVHFVMLGALALWLNARFRGALRRAREGA